MNDSTSDLMEILANTSLFMFILATVLSLFSVGRDTDKVLEQQMKNKSTIIYTLAYGKEDRYITAEVAITDIIATTNETIKVNGHTLSDEKLEKLRSYDDVAIRNMKNDLGNKEYKKVLTFDSQGYVIEIDFVERR